MRTVVGTRKSEDRRDEDRRDGEGFKSVHLPSLDSDEAALVDGINELPAESLAKLLKGSCKYQNARQVICSSSTT